jgi:UDP-3-O-[3-hydroxymyristoyl] glucosamine N-acyltransferase
LTKMSRSGKAPAIWHFSHLMKRCKLGTHCNIGQNVFIASGVVLGNNVKVQNNVSLYTGVTCDDDVFLGPSCVFTNVVNPRSTVVRRDKYVSTHVGKGATGWSECNDHLWKQHRVIRFYWRRCGSYKARVALCACSRVTQPGKPAG